MANGNTKLDYLFEIEYLDGSKFRQHPHDLSKKFPPMKDENGVWQGKTSWTDIKDDVENFKIKRFSLHKKNKLFTNWIAPLALVDLIDGHFEINGMKFIPEGGIRLLGEDPISHLPVENPKFKLFYRRIRRELANATYEAAIGQVTNIEGAGSLPIIYKIGWMCEFEGRSYEQFILIQ